MIRESLHRLREHYLMVYQREKSFIMSLDPEKLNKALKISFAALLIFNIFDVASTLLCLYFIPEAVEQNRFFAPLLTKGLPELIFALIVKFGLLPAVAIGVIIPIKGKHEMWIRIMKLGFSTAIIVASPFYIWALYTNFSILLG
jgi:hypothetical protein